MPKNAQKPYKRVKVTLACVVCRKKKVKCDGIQPSCSRCHSMGYHCEYSNPPKKRGPPKGHVEVIESRARRIESLLGKDYRVVNSGCRYAEDTDCEGSQLLFRQCQHYLGASSSNRPTLQTTQALIILCWYAFLVGDMQELCFLRQKLVHFICQLNLGTDPKPYTDTTWNTEIQRRTFWVAYVMDRWLATCTGEQLLTGDYSCQWPQLEDSQLCMSDNESWTQEEGPGYSFESAIQVMTFREMIKLGDILGERQMDRRVAALVEWLIQLPAYLEYGPIHNSHAPSPMARIFRMLYYTVQIHIHAPAAEDATKIRSSIRTTAANTIIHIAEQMVRDQQHKYLYNAFGLSVSLASSVHLSNVPLPEDMSAATINVCNSLRILKEANCSLLSPIDFGHLVDRFVFERYGIDMENHQIKAQKQIKTALSEPVTHCNVYGSSFLANGYFHDPTRINNPFQSFYSYLSYDSPTSLLIPPSSSSSSSITTPIDSLGSSSSPCSIFSPYNSPDLLGDDNHVHVDDIYGLTMLNQFL
ncbi:hypothetical protein EC973_005640 [Apophysomyces ossiformis]|uniref:Zn(2)-C6 fungal-type domain-containing protein n=1 Tax=Apophysomyces ossiformis TaxID=679940 RepID=A0A8H7BFY6_9FUNG|nr:hypothetical protein EC973_005640 [Apophysomyces ossiformis]